MGKATPAKTPAKAAPTKASAPAPGKAVARAEQQSTALAKGAVSAAMLKQDAAQPKDFGRDDLAIPFLRVLQSGSPQVKKSEAEYIKGAEEGDFFNTVTQEIWGGTDNEDDDTTGVVVIPVAYTPSYIEWQTRDNGGGLVKDHGADGSLMAQTQKDDKNRDILPNGNQLVRSGLYYVLQVDPETGIAQQMAFPLASTQLKKARKWNSVIASLLVDDGNGGKFNPAMFYMAYRITTVPESNDQGSWMGVKIVPFKPTLELPNGEELYLAARQYRSLVAEGKVKVQEPGAPATDGGVEIPF